MVETRNNTRQPRPPPDAQNPKGEEVASRVNVGSEERDEANDEVYKENFEGYDTYYEGSYTKLLVLRQKVADHEVKLAAQKEQNKRMEEVMVVMRKAMDTAGIHIHPKDIPAGLEETPKESSSSTQKPKTREPSLIRYPFEENLEKNPTSIPRRKKKAQDLQKVQSNFPKGKGPQRGKLPRASLGPQNRED
uniref:Uncharacterized protein n=1 Tax=Cannabis sativa TaxID=3483 RepID=A0A803P5H8_CANSA